SCAEATEARSRKGRVPTLPRRIPARVRRNPVLRPSGRVAQAVVDRVVDRYRVERARTHIVPSGGNLSGLRRIPRPQARAMFDLPMDDRPVIGSVGTLRAPKRYERILSAAATLRARHGIHPWILLTGDGPERPRIDAAARALGIFDDIRFGPRTADIGPQFSALDVFLLPSDFEGMPLVVPEAMAMGCPVVASRVAGIPEVIEHGERGWLVEVGNVDALADHVADIVLRRVDVDGVIQAAKTYALAHHTSEAYGQAFATCCAEALAGQRRSSTRPPAAPTETV
ncbi:MAG: glycosyltransferase, partial [Planctomycetota bacterium]